MLWNLLDRFTDLVGPTASAATFHYASVQEGRRIASEGPRPRDLGTAVARVDAMLGHHTTVTNESQGSVTLVVSGSRMLHEATQVRQAVVQGLLEGVIRTVWGRVAIGKVLPGHGDETRLEFELKEAALA